MPADPSERRPREPAPPPASGAVPQFFRAGCGSVLALTSLFFFVIFLAPSTSQHDTIGMRVALGVLWVVPLVVSVLLLFSFFRKRGTLRREAEEHLILELAGQQRGLVTVVEVARSTRLSLERTRARLDELVRQGHATLDLTEAGATVYRFPDLCPREPLLAEDPVEDALEELESER